MQNFLRNHWDKFLTLLAGGLFGYFSALLAIDAQIDAVSEDLQDLKTKAQTIFEPTAGDVKEMTNLQAARKGLVDLELSKIEQKFDASAELGRVEHVQLDGTINDIRREIELLESEIDLHSKLLTMFTTQFQAELERVRSESLDIIADALGEQRRDMLTHLGDPRAEP